jgi:hypothetical protein
LKSQNDHIAGPIRPDKDGVIVAVQGWLENWRVFFGGKLAIICECIKSK